MCSEKLPLPRFPDWVPEIVRHVAKEHWDAIESERNPTYAREVLERLISHSLMKRVWHELYRRKKDGGEQQFCNSACLTSASTAAAYRAKARVLRAKGGEKKVRVARRLEFEAQIIEKLPARKLDPAWSEQDQAVGLFFRAAYRASLDSKPQLLADARRVPDALNNVAKELRRLAKELQSIDWWTSYTEKLIEVAVECESDAAVNTPKPKRHPGLAPKEHGDLRQRAFVGQLWEQTDYLFGKPLYRTIANITNVVFCKTSDDGGRSSTQLEGGGVREILRERKDKISPSFDESFVDERELIKQDMMIARRYLASAKRLASATNSRVRRRR